MLVENQDFGVAAGKTNRQFVVIRHFAIHDVISAGDGDFDGPVEIHEHRSGQMTPPIIEVLGGENFADEKYLGDAIQLELGQQIQIGNVHHDGRHPENEVDRAGVATNSTSLGGNIANCSGTTTQVAPLAMHQAELQCVSVEINRRQAAHHLGSVQAEPVERPIHKINRVAMIQRHALWVCRLNPRCE